MAVVQNPTIPCLFQIPGGFPPGAMIRISGDTPKKANRFAVNLQCGPNTDPRDEIALHFNVRFKEQLVVRNNLVGNNWGQEEQYGGMPFVKGQPFSLLFMCEQNSIKAAVNNAHFCEFQHRTSLGRISHITIDGDVNISAISFEGAAPQAPPQGGQAYAPPPQYGAPAYGAPPAPYGAPPAPYGAPPGSPPAPYGAPPGAPPAPYGAPPGQYGQPYGAPPAPYGQAPGYGPPPPGYGPPGYGAFQGNY